MTSFVDSRDSGAIFVTHFTLLLGMAAPLWLSDALYLPAGGGTRGDRNGGAAAGEAPPLWPAGMAGIVILGERGEDGILGSKTRRSFFPLGTG